MNVSRACCSSLVPFPSPSHRWMSYTPYSFALFPPLVVPRALLVAHVKNCCYDFGVAAVVACFSDFCGMVASCVVSVGKFRFSLRNTVVLPLPVAENCSWDHPRDLRSSIEVLPAWRRRFFRPLQSLLVLDPALAHRKIGDRTVDYSWLRLFVIRYDYWPRSDTSGFPVQCRFPQTKDRWFWRKSVDANADVVVDTVVMSFPVIFVQFEIRPTERRGKPKLKRRRWNGWSEACCVNKFNHRMFSSLE